MKNICAVAIIKIVLVSLMLSFDASAQLPRATSFDDRPICEAEKGSWRRFGNGCADSCQAKFDPFSICSNALIYSCDCGDNRCWNGKYCVLLEDYKRVYDSVQARKQKTLDQKKEERRALAQANRQLILKRMIAPPPSEKEEGKKGKNKKNNDDKSNNTPNEPVVDNQMNDTTEVQIPPFFLKKQAQQEALRKANAEAMQNGENTPPALPDVPLP